MCQLLKQFVFFESIIYYSYSVPVCTCVYVCVYIPRVLPIPPPAQNIIDAQPGPWAATDRLGPRDSDPPRAGP